MITIHSMPFRKLKNIWNQLYFSNPQLPPYLRYSCHRLLRVWIPFRYRIIPQNVTYYVAYKDGTPICIMPLYGKDSRSIYVSNGICYTDFIYADTASSEDIALILAELKKLINAPFRFLLLPPDSKLLQTGIPYEKQYITYAIHFRDGYDAYKAGLSKHTRQNIRTARNHLSNDNAECRTEVYIRRRIPRSALNAIAKIAASRILEIVERDEGFVNRRPRWNLFVRTMFYRMCDPVFKYLKRSENNFLATLKINGEIAAFMYGALTQDGLTVLIPKLAYSSRFKPYSPGILLIDDTVRYLCENTAVRTLDLAEGNEPYKITMGGTESAAFCARM